MCRSEINVILIAVLTKSTKLHYLTNAIYLTYRLNFVSRTAYITVHTAGVTFFLHIFALTWNQTVLRTNGTSTQSIVTYPTPFITLSTIITRHLLWAFVLFCVVYCCEARTFCIFKTTVSRLTNGLVIYRLANIFIATRA